MTSRVSLPKPMLMLVTDRRRVASGDHTGEEALDDVAREAALGGVDCVQLREKDLDTANLIALGLHVRDAITDRALLVVNGNMDAAHALDAAGVHLPQDGPTVLVARSVVGNRPTVSISVHSIEQAEAAERDGADFIVAGTVFASASKPGAQTIGLDGLRAICEATPIPVIAIGGITAANAGDAIRLGASGVAVIGAIMDTPDPRVAARELRTAIDKAGSAR